MKNIPVIRRSCVHASVAGETLSWPYLPHHSAEGRHRWQGRCGGMMGWQEMPLGAQRRFRRRAGVREKI